MKITNEHIGKRVIINGTSEHGEVFKNMEADILYIGKYGQDKIVIKSLIGFLHLVSEDMISFPCDYEFKDTTPLPMKGGFVDIGYEPSEIFHPEYFTGLPQDVERAKKYIGCKMEFSDNGREWFATTLEGISTIDARNPYRTDRKDYDSEWFMFCRTCPKTFKSEPKYIKFGPGQIPAPETEEPERGTVYFTIDYTANDEYNSYKWASDTFDNRCFERGIYLKESRIQEAVSVIRGIMGRKGK